MASTTEKRNRNKSTPITTSPLPPGFKRAEYWFGEEEEVANRDDAHNNSILATPPVFTQIKPAVTGRNMNRPQGPDRSGRIKFSNFKGL